jgi:predicted hydrocarbon binding protein
MDLRKEAVGLRIFLGSLTTELIKLYGKLTVNAIIYRIGQKPGEIIAEQILERYNKTIDDPFDNPSAAFNLLENSVTQLFDEEQIGLITEEEKITIKIKNVCPFRQVIMGREDFEFGGTLCQFSSGYFESALKMLTDYNVEYSHDAKETNDDYCVINIIFRKKPEVNSILSNEIEPVESK